jgi:soluble lytic murein transglycosylase-like protein
MFVSKIKVKAIMLLCILACLILPVTNTSADSTKINNHKANFQKIAAIVTNECRQYKYVPPEVILAIISKESGFNTNALYINKSGTRFIGVMQINSKTAEILWKHFYPGLKMDIKKLSDPEVNIKLGIWHFNNSLSKYHNNVEMALTAYNKGDGGFKKLVASRGTYSSPYSRSIMILSRRYKIIK